MNKLNSSTAIGVSKENESLFEPRLLLQFAAVFLIMGLCLIGPAAVIADDRENSQSVAEEEEHFSREERRERLKENLRAKIVKTKIDDGDSSSVHIAVVDADEAAETVEIVMDEVFTSIREEWHSLDEEEREEIKAAIKDGIHIEGDAFGMGFGETLVAFTAITLFFGMPLLLLLLIFVFSHKKRAKRMELVQSFLDAGQPVPDDILAEYVGTGPTSDLNSGIRLTALSMGVFLAIGIVANWSVAAIAFIPMFIGIARIVNAKLSKKEAQQMQQVEGGSE